MQCPDWIIHSSTNVELLLDRLCPNVNKELVFFLQSVHDILHIKMADVEEN